MSYLLRLVMPDRPGILGAVATALGTAGIDIVSLDVLERGTGVAVDDVVVDLSKNRSRRYCDGGCAARAHTAAYRARKAAGA